MTVTIDPEFKSLIPPLTTEELSGLESSIIKEGCRDALIVWPGKNDILIDGHNRYEICQRHGIKFEIKNISFATRDDAIDWIYSNQLSRRNLTDESRTYLLGKQYSSRKKRDGERGPQKVDQNDPASTAEKIGNEQGVSAPTVKRAEEYSRAIDKLSLSVGKETTDKILSGQLNTTKQGIVTLSEALPEEQKKVIDLLVSGDAKGLQDAKRIIASELVKDIPPVSGKYKVIYADPPWEYGGSMNTTYGTADKHYPTMTLDDICALPIKDLSEDNAVLFLWTTSPCLEDTFKVISAWGFKYKASFIWDKIKHVMGHYNSVRHEFLLISTKGSCTPEVMKLFDSVVSEERTEHSAKPETFREIIDTIYPSGKRIELFARDKHDGWETWGNQV